MKKAFETPELDVIEMMVEDIITTSGNDSEGYAPDTGGDHGFGERP